MLVPTIVTFTGLAPSTTLYKTAVEHTQLLGCFAHKIAYCEVTFRANLKHCRDGNRFLIQVSTALHNSARYTEYGIACHTKGGQASPILRRILLALAQRIDDRAPCPRLTDKPCPQHSPVPP